MYIKAIAWLQEYTSVQKHMEDWAVTFKHIKNHLCFQMYLWYKHINTSTKHRLSEQLGKNVPLGVLPKWLSLYQVPIISPSCLTLCEPMDYIVHGILQATILAWVAVPFTRGPSQLRDQTQVSRIAGRFFASWATRKALLFAQLCSTLCNPMDYSLPGSSVQEISQARILEWVSFSRGSNLNLLYLLHWQTDSLTLSHWGSPMWGISGH